MRRFAPLLIIVVALLGGLAAGVGWTIYELNTRHKPISDIERARMHPDTLAGYDAMVRGDQDEALRFWRSREADNDAAALYYIGRAYAEGEGVSQDWELAKNYFQKSANLGNGKSMNYLGIMHQNGHAFRKSVLTAIKHYKSAGLQNYAAGYYNIGLILYRGLGVGKNLEEAMKYFQKAAALGHCPSIRKLGFHHFDQGNFDDSLFFFELSKKNGCGIWFVHMIASYKARQK